MSVTMIKQANFRYADLDAKAQQKAFQKWYELQCGSYPWNKENRDTLEKFVAAIGHGCRSYMDGDGIDTSNMDDTILELKGKRALAWFWNNVKELFPMERQYVKHPWKYKRTSRVKVSKEPALYGYWLDYEITDAVYSLWTKAGYGARVGDVLKECSAAWEKGVELDVEHYHSEEYFIEECSNRSMWFDRSGKLISEDY